MRVNRANPLKSTVLNCAITFCMRFEDFIFLNCFYGLGAISYYITALKLDRFLCILLNSKFGGGAELLGTLFH